MKKVLACLLGILPFVSSPASAYQINLISSQNIESMPAFLETLEKYETSALTKLSSALKDSKIDPDSIVTIGIDQDGAFSEFKYKSSQQDPAAKKIIQDARTINFGKIPNLKSGTLRLALEYKELEAKIFKRKLYIVKTPDGQSIGGTGGIGITGIVGGDGKNGLQVEMLKEKGPVVAVPYSDKDRKFDSEIVSLYSNLKGVTNTATRPVEYSFRTRSIPEEQEKITQKELADKNWLHAAMSILHEIKLTPDSASAKLPKVSELVAKLSPKEREVFTQALLEMNRDHFSYRTKLELREEIAKLAYTTVKNKNFTNLQIKLDAINNLAQIYSSSNKKPEAITYYKEALAVTLAKGPSAKDEAVAAYDHIGQMQFESAETENLSKTVAEAVSFIEKEYSKNSIRLIPFLVLSIKNETTEAKKAAVYAHLEKIVNDYSNPQSGSSIRDKDAAAGARVLTNNSYVVRYRRSKEDLLSEEMQVNFARLAYKLQLKASSKFDHTAFHNLARAFHSTGRYKQEVELHKNAIAYLEGTDERMEKTYLGSLRNGYAKALEAAGDTQAADKERNCLKAQEDKKASEFKQRMEDQLADLEMKQDSNPVEKAHCRVLLLSSYVTAKDTAKTKDTLEKLKQNLEAIQGKSDRLMGTSSQFASILRRHSDFLSSNESIESLFIKDLLLIDEKSDERHGSLALRRLDFNFGREETPLQKKIKSALEESRNARGDKSR